ncbi:MAG: hypothetical protein LBR46_05445 [Prevotella sp.]|nr:hypothetical protein [Prevotella sp.]
MKKIWARLGMVFEVSDENYKLVDEAMKNKDNEKVSEILFKSKCYTGGESYIPVGCEDNPNEVEFNL